METEAALHDAIAYAADLIAQSDAIVVGAGAGMGVDSGLPDFRGAAGFWRAYPALKSAGLGFTEIASPDRFDSDPALAWGFYGHRLQLYRDTVPHAGFAILRRWVDHAPLGGRIYTSNVDGQFQRAGVDPEAIVECHGSLHHLQCTVPCSPAIWSADALRPVIDVQRCRWLGEAPRCPRCGAVARPNVLMFGDGAWVPGRTNQQRAAMERWLDQVRRPVFIELGAGVDIPSVRHFGHRIVQQYGGRMVRINPRDYQPPTPFDVGLPLGALVALQRIDAAGRST